MKLYVIICYYHGENVDKAETYSDFSWLLLTNRWSRKLKLGLFISVSLQALLPLLRLSVWKTILEI
jgi:hypothetical protein